VINDGSAQRSMVTKLVVTFSRQVTIASGAFRLMQVQPDGSLVDKSALVSVQAQLVDGKTVATLQFFNPAGVKDVIGLSLPDGNYRLVIQGVAITDASGNPFAV